MKKQIVRTLKAGCLCLAAALPSLFAQSAPSLTVVLPFDFQVNNQRFPAGKYQVNGAAGGVAVLLQGVDTKRAGFSTTGPVSRNHALPVGTLVFHRYEDRYFLSQIWMPGDYSGRSLPRSSAEREMARRIASASPDTKPVVVAVLAASGVSSK